MTPSSGREGSGGPPADPTSANGVGPRGDAIVVGSGVAGLSAALELARQDPALSVVILTRGPTGGHGASPLAQGGVAAALDPSDSPELHAFDTEAAADGLARSELVEILTRDGPDRVRELMRLGARFDRGASGSLSLGLEGAHSRRRIVHAQGDRTGAEVMRALGQAVLATPSIRVLEDLEAVELHMEQGRVAGVLARSPGGDLRLFRSSATLLATGGPGRVYLYTTAPRGLDGDGLAMAARAGAELRDLEFIQFHPTALNVEADPLPLVSEALRGAGARLVDDRGNPVSEAGDRGDLAARDQVARAIWRRIREGRAVFLDSREALGVRIRDAFPGVHALCLEHGVDPTREAIPVTPAAHYHMGGVAVDAEGRTSLPGLWAAGEVAASGVHGANRLASNSLLEGLVFGPVAARSIALALGTAGKSGRVVAAGGQSQEGSDPQPPSEKTRVQRGEDRGLPAEVLTRIRTIMWERVGIVRSGPALAAAVAELDAIESELAHTAPYTRNLLLTGRLIARAALLRAESLGSHFREDFPSRAEGPPRHSVIALAPGAAGGVRASMDDAYAGPGFREWAGG